MAAGRHLWLIFLLLFCQICYSYSFEKSDQWSRRRCDNEIITVLTKGQLAILKITAIWPYLLMDRVIFGQTHLDIERNSYARFRRNSSCGFGVAITVKIKVGHRRPYLSSDRNHFRACTIRPLEEQHRQVTKKSDQWSLRRCDNEKKFTDGRMDVGRCQYGLSSTYW